MPVHDDRKLFESLILEGAQAGLSWTTILNKRKNYRKAFDGFRAEKIVRYGARDVKRLLADIRDRAKPAQDCCGYPECESILAVRKEFEEALTVICGVLSAASQSKIAGAEWLRCPQAHLNPTQ